METIEFWVFLAIALFIGTMAVLHLSESMNVNWFQRRIPQLTLIMLSLVIGALLLEAKHSRHGEIEQQRKQCERTERMLAKYDEKYQNHTLGGRYLRGVNEVHESGLELIMTATKRIRVFWVLGGPRPPADYFEKYAAILAEIKRNGISVGVDVVYALDVDNIPEDFMAIIESDRAIYQQHGVEKLVTPYIVDMKRPHGFSVLAVDRKHAQISFPPMVDIESLERGMQFVDQDELVTDLVAWFDKDVIPSAIPLREWTGSNRMQLGSGPATSKPTLQRTGQ